MKAAALLLTVGITALAAVASAQTSNPRAAYRKACQNDMKSLCPSTQGARRMLMCLRANQAKLSSECQKALSELPAPAAPTRTTPPQN